MFDIHMGINNMLDQQYASNFTAPNNLQLAGDSAFYYPGTPRYFYAGVRVELVDWPALFNQRPKAGGY